MHNFIPNLKIGKIDDYLLSLANHMHCSINQVIEDKTESPLQHLSHTWIIWTDQEFFFNYDNFCNFKLLITEAKYYSWYTHNTNNPYTTWI